MASDNDLEDAIRAVIQPWQDSETKPPFSQGQLIVMALVLSQKPLPSRQIIQWQVSTFGYYKQAVCASFCSRRHSWYF